jgi:hypothetical protein|tara:strand:- start:595 stop:828 length:234 start_codon:yes stop_codon:yes gene_type:complete
MSDKNEFPISDSTFLLSSFGILATCFSGFLAFILKSRCTEISWCGFRCVRDVLPPETITELDRTRRGTQNVEVITRS